MKPLTVEIFDSTLRDGAQGEGIHFSVEDKLAIVKALDKLGVSYVEAGNPGSNQKDLAFFERAAELKLNYTRLVAFGSTRRRGVTPKEDANCLSLLKAGTDTVAIFGKCWDLHVTEILRASLAENLEMVTDTLRFFKEAGKRVFFDAEHFFDGYKANPEYALSVLDAAVTGGADCLVLCETNGGCLPDEVYEITKTVRERYAIPIGIHTHNDTECAVANSLMAVKAGATHVQGTFLGFGERCGNACLASLIANLQIKCGYHCIPADNLPLLTETARYVAEVANVRLESGAPYVGNSAFAHKGGMHIDGVSKLARTFEHIPPQTVGNKRRLLMSEVSGRGAVLPMIQRLAPQLHKDSPEAYAVSARLKELEFEGYQYEAAEASFELVVRKILGLYKSFFTLIHYRIINEQSPGNSSSALIKVHVDGKEEITAADGDGPVNALDKALRRALEVFYPNLAKVRLVDYKVRVLDSQEATAAKVRVLIQSTDGVSIWTTVGVSANIIEASWKALADSMKYKLIHDEESVMADAKNVM